MSPAPRLFFLTRNIQGANVPDSAVGANIAGQSKIGELPELMLVVDGKLEKGMKEAADFFQVSEKTLRNWLNSGKLSPPPQIRQGTRVLRYFPEKYLWDAKDHLGL